MGRDEAERAAREKNARDFDEYTRFAHEHNERFRQAREREQRPGVPHG